MNTKEIARKKGLLHKFDFAMSLIWCGNEWHHKVGNYVMIHYMNHKNIFGADYLVCNSVSDLNEAKSKLLNAEFKIDWDVFNSALEHLNEH